MAATQMPFLDSFCLLSLTVIPIVQVWQSDAEALSCFNEMVGYRLNK
jgi:hypothetical protein